MSPRRSSPTDAPLLAWGEALREQKQRRSKIRHRIAIVGAGAAIVLASAALPPMPRLVWNASSSAPIGLYRVTPGAPIAPRDMVIARMPEQYRAMAAARRYLPLNVPLVKGVAAYAGDEVCALDRQIFINGAPVAARRKVDGHGRTMPMWSGCIRLRGRQLFLLMENPASFDGRYFGVTEGGDVIGKATLLWQR